MLPFVFAGRTNPLHADMLVVIELGVKRFLGGANPYTLYHVPWEVPLPVRPLSVGTLHPPDRLEQRPTAADAHRLPRHTGRLHLGGNRLRSDRPAHGLRAVRRSAWGDVDSSGAARVLRDRAHAGLLAAAVRLCVAAARRTLDRCRGHGRVPSSWHGRPWSRSCRSSSCSSGRYRLLSISRLVVLAAAVVIPFAPFAISDADALWYGFYGHYQKVMKGVVWPTHGAPLTPIGTTGLLLRYGLEQYVELTQAIGMLVVYAFAWRAIRRGARPGALAGPRALRVFDDLALAGDLRPFRRVYASRRGACRQCARTGTAAPASGLRDGGSVHQRDGNRARRSCGQAGRGTGDRRRRPVLTRVCRPGFRTRGSIHQGRRSYARMSAAVGTLRIPRASRASSSVHLVAKGCSSQTGVQRVEAALNGQSLGSAVLKNDWEDIAFKAPARTWYYGVNMLDLRFISPLAAGEASGSNPVAGTPGCRCHRSGEGRTVNVLIRPRAVDDVLADGPVPLPILRLELEQLR